MGTKPSKPCRGAGRAKGLVILGSAPTRFAGAVLAPICRRRARCNGQCQQSRSLATYGGSGHGFSLVARMKVVELSMRRADYLGEYQSRVDSVDGCWLADDRAALGGRTGAAWCSTDWCDWKPGIGDMQSPPMSPLQNPPKVLARPAGNTITTLFARPTFDGKIW